MDVAFTLLVYSNVTLGKPPLLDELRTAEGAVQDRHMIGIDHVLEMLQPVARRDHDAAAADARIVRFDELSRPRHLEALVARQHRLLLRRAEIGEHQAVTVLGRIPRLAHAPALRASRVGLCRHLQAPAFDVEQPAVIAAADTALLDLAVVERGAAMAAARIDEARPALPVPEQDELLAQDLDRPRRSPASLLRPTGCQ
jgi:hypothetical protein